MKLIRATVFAAIGTMVLACSPQGDAPVGSDVAVDSKELKRAKKVVERREAVMGLMGWSAGPMAGMVKEEAPYDAELFSRQARRLAGLADMTADLFKADVRAFDVHTEAKPEIWDDYGDFEQLAQDLLESSQALVLASEAGDLAAASEAFKAVADDCKACHDKYKEDDH